MERIRGTFEVQLYQTALEAFKRELLKAVAASRDSSPATLQTTDAQLPSIDRYGNPCKRRTFTFTLIWDDYSD